MSHRQIQTLQSVAALLCVLTAAVASMNAFQRELPADRAVAIVVAALALAIVILPARDTGRRTGA